MRKLRVLCLHGMHQNAEVFHQKTASFRYFSILVEDKNKNFQKGNQCVSGTWYVIDCAFQKNSFQISLRECTSQNGRKRRLYVLFNLSLCSSCLFISCFSSFHFFFSVLLLLPFLLFSSSLFFFFSVLLLFFFPAFSFSCFFTNFFFSAYQWYSVEGDHFSAEKYLKIKESIQTIEDAFRTSVNEKKEEKRKENKRK